MAAYSGPIHKMREHSKLPLRITLLLWLVLIITALNMVRLVTSIAWHNALETYAPQPGPIYIGVTGAIWTLLGLFLLGGFIRGVRGIRAWFVLAAFVYAAWTWADKLWVQTQLRANWPFDLLATILLLGYTGCSCP